MQKLELELSERAGAHAVAEWLKATVEAEGTDRPQFAAITSYIITDIEEAISGADATLEGV